MDTLFKDILERISEVMEQFDCGEILFADSSQQKRSVVENAQSSRVTAIAFIKRKTQ